MITLTETLHPGAFIIAEADDFHCRDSVQIALSQTLLGGQVLGGALIVAGVTSSVIIGTNTGNGVAALAAPAVSQAVVNGDYLLTCTAAAANAGTFSVQTPDGREIGPLTVAVAFDKEIKLTIADGATDFVVGDSFKVRVGIERSDFEYLALNLTAVTGAQHSAAIMVGGIVTDGITKKKAAALVRGPAQVRGSDLTWPAGITAAQKAAEVAKLESRGIIVR